MPPKATSANRHALSHLHIPLLNVRASGVHKCSVSEGYFELANRKSRATARGMLCCTKELAKQASRLQLTDLLYTISNV